MSIFTVMLTEKYERMNKMSNRKARNSRPTRNPSPIKGYTLVEDEKLEKLITAKIEMSVLLNAYANGCESYRLEDIIAAFCRIHEIEVKR